MTHHFSWVWRHQRRAPMSRAAFSAHCRHFMRRHSPSSRAYRSSPAALCALAHVSTRTPLLSLASLLLCLLTRLSFAPASPPLISHHALMRASLSSHAYSPIRMLLPSRISAPSLHCASTTSRLLLCLSSLLLPRQHLCHHLTRLFFACRLTRRSRGKHRSARALPLSACRAPLSPTGAICAYLSRLASYRNSSYAVARYLFAHRLLARLACLYTASRMPRTASPRLSPLFSSPRLPLAPQLWHIKRRQ